MNDSSLIGEVIRHKKIGMDAGHGLVTVGYYGGYFFMSG
jgi:hypothetical protein